MFLNGISTGVVLGFVMSLAYAGLGIYLLLIGHVFSFSNVQKFGIGIVLISYGLFRLYRTLKQRKENILQEQIKENDKE